MVNRSGTVNCWNVRLAGMVRVVSTTPGRIEPQGEPTPGKLDAPLKLPCSVPIGAPRRVTSGTGLVGGPVIPKFGPTPPTNGNCTNGWLPTGRKRALPG